MKEQTQAEAQRIVEKHLNIAEELIELHSCVIIDGIKFDNPIPATIEHAIKTQERVISRMVNMKFITLDKYYGTISDRIAHERKILEHLKSLI